MMNNYEIDETAWKKNFSDIALGNTFYTFIV